MFKSIRPILTELLWVIAAFAITLLICRFVFSWDVSSGKFDLHLHDAYFVFSSATIIAPLFLVVTFVLYFIKEFRVNFGRTLANVILLSSGLLLIILIAYVNKEFIRLGTNVSWTSYPPLSELPKVEPGTAELNPIAAVVTNALTLLQVVLTITLLYTTFEWGKRKKQSSYNRPRQSGQI